jgi:hypothetical protein
MSYFSRAVLMGMVGSAASTLAIAAPPSTSAYATDPQNLSVQDETAQGIGSLNMVLCVIGGIDPGAEVNVGPYVALVDMNKCQNAKGGNSAAGSAANYANAIVDVTRTSNADPMIGKVWLTFTQDGGPVTVYAHLSATQSPSAAPPYGAFRMDYIGKMDGNVGFNGYIDSTQPGVISFLETGQQSSNTALAMSASSTTSGSGTMLVGGNGGGNPVTFDFAYNPGFFRRSDGTNDECFDRSLANASLAVWQYGTYNADDGTRLDQAHPGFAVLATYGGSSYYGFANYWGINFQGLTIPDGAPVPNLTVADQRQGNSTTYALNKIGGRLTKWTQVSTTLAALDKIPFTYNGDLTGITTGNSSVSGMNSWVMQWDSANAIFTVVGVQVCSMNSGCVTTSLNPVATVNATAFNDVPVTGWASSYGGNINIPPKGSAHVAGDAVFYFNQSSVTPGTSALTLYCLNQCPTAAQIQSYANSSENTPFASGTDMQWFSAPDPSHTVTYTFGAGGLLDGNDAPVVWENIPSDSSYSNGLQTGWLVDSPPSTANCPAASPDAQQGNLCQPANPATYYTWQTGANQWNQSLWLTSAGTIIPFDPPQNVAYTVPNAAAYGSYAGLPILLQFNGFGNLQGIPGTCVDPTDNSVVDCGTNGASYVPAFSIPDGTTMSLPSLSGAASTPLIVKALNGAILLKNLGSNAAQCSSMTLAPLTLPSGGLHDPSSSGDSDYLGTEPTVTASPKVIDGVVQ